MTGSVPTPRPVSTYIEDGVRIAAILLVWSVIASVFTYGVSDLGGTGGLLATFGPRLGTLFGVVGILNAISYLLFRTVDYWHSQD